MILNQILDTQGFFRVMTGLSCLLIILIPFNIWAVLSRGSKQHNQNLKNARIAEEIKLSPWAEYESEMRKGGFWIQRKIETAVTDPRMNLAEAVKDFRLKGIVMVDEPEAIIEDARNQKTIFVRAGEKLGPALIKTIKEDSVTVSMGTEVQEFQMGQSS